MKKRLAIIPARGGSKGIPLKNIYLVNQKPLIYYSIKEALKAKELGMLDTVVVSTDSEKIASIAKEYGADVPFLRPSNMAADNAKSVDLMIHAIDFFRKKGQMYDDVVLLQPTSPLRSCEDICGAINAYEKQSIPTLVSCYKEESVSEYNSYYMQNGIGIPRNVDHNKGKRRQELPELFVRNGAIFITNTEFLLEKKLVISDNPILYIMPKERSINIDTEYDMKLAEWMIMNA